MERLDPLRAEPGSSGIFLDFDGTLAPIVPEPHRAQMVPGAREVLEKLAGRFKLVALISGRAAADLHSRVGATGPRYFGLYGAEEMTGEGIRQPDIALQWRRGATNLVNEAAEFIARERLDGCEVEWKDLAVSIHYRLTGQDSPPKPLLEWAQVAAPRWKFGVGVGRKVIELRPESVTKAGTLEYLVGESELSRVLVGGDDAADVGMMKAAEQILPGAAVRVGVRSAEEPAELAAEADIDVWSPAELVELLRELL